ncbi:hypothetical protein [Primorskyibacter flagellatus]|uniref:Uncharacterized protein n=1 Tax=Primorskyibacter flagellatus TaxID=1387277 RepID=A0A1W1Z7M7_9RHOB|nr:hypothetical protein [Primorskyibacter flagellatus]SMC44413.1 hypothetical protein SAMN06295998_101319 [Primorskyibacter flagellatus]
MTNTNYFRHLEFELESLKRAHHAILPEWAAKKLSHHRAKENLRRAEELTSTARRIAMDRQEEFRDIHSDLSANAMEIREIEDELFPFGKRDVD